MLDLLTISSLISFGAWVAFSVVKLAVIKRYFIDAKARGTWGLFHNLVLLGTGFALRGGLAADQPERLVVHRQSCMGLLCLAVLTRGFRRPAPQLDLKEV